MSQVKQVISDNISTIIADMNKELLQDRIIRFWAKVGSELTLNELVNKFWSDESKSEFFVDLGVSFGKIFELYLPFFLQQQGVAVMPKFSSAGDFIEIVGDDIEAWEIKTGQGTHIQGATHSPKEKKSLNLIQLLWTPVKDKSLDEIMETGCFIDAVNLCVFTDVVGESIGEHSANNSRTSLKFPVSKVAVCEDACVYGEIKPNRTWVGFTKLPATV
jgi:hypothetical protein